MNDSTDTSAAFSMLTVIRQQLLFFARLMVFYLLLFAAWRGVFLAVNLPAGSVSFAQILLSFVYGLRIDLSAIGYLLLPVVLLAGLSWLFNLRLFHRINIIYNRCLVVFLTLVLLGNVIIYHFWGTLLNYRAITYLSDPKEAIASVSSFQFLGLLTVLVTSIVVAIIGQRKWMPAEFPAVSTSQLKPAFGWLTISILLSLSIRGGWQQLPMNESLVYFSDRPVLNSAAVNPLWHLTYDTRMALTQSRNPFRTLPDDQADNYFSALRLTANSSSEKIVKAVRPNVVVILLESFTADIIRSLGGEDNITPVFDSLVNEGFLFENIYSSGFRTDQGIVSVLNGWPATPYHSIMRAVDKSRKLPSLCKVLTENGYQSSFNYGGESNFSNMKSYVIDQGFGAVVDADKFDDTIPRGQWGIHDEEMLHRNASDLNSARQPFFSVMVTLSNHEPFDVPGKKYFPGNDAASKFRNAAAYTDAAIGDYFRQVSKMSWYQNTLFVLVADHAHELPRHRNVLYPEGRHIPMLFFGPALADSVKGRRCATFGGHHDLARTLLHQLQLPAQEFVWSKDLLNSNAVSFAYLPHENYLLWTSGKGWFIWMVDRGTITERSKGFTIKDDDEEALQARSFMQKHYDAYLAY